MTQRPPLHVPLVDDQGRITRPWAPFIAPQDAQSGGGTPSVSEHNVLTGRDAPDCHPQSAITGLPETLESLGSLVTDVSAGQAEQDTKIAANANGLVSVSTTLQATQAVQDGRLDVLEADVAEIKEEYPRYAGVAYPGPEGLEVGTGLGKIRMPACVVYLFDNPNFEGAIKKYAVPEAEFTLADGGNQLVVVYHNLGAPAYLLVNATSSSYNNSDIIPVYRFWRSGTTIHSQSVDSLGDGLPEKIAERIGNTEYYKRTEAGGLIIGAAGLTLTITAANVYAGAVRVAIGAFSSATNTLYRVTLNATTWTYTPSTTINNTYYNTNAGLVTAGANKYLVAFYYSSIGDAVEAFEILGTDQYSNIGAAIAAAPRADLPSVVAKHCMLVGRVVIQKGAATASEIDSTFTTQFASSGVTDHNSLSNLQSAQSGVTYGHITDGAQTIDGVKTFSSQIVATSVKSAGPSLYLLDSAGAVRIQCDTSPAEVVIQGNLLPMVDDAYNIGSTSLKPHYIYSSKLYTADISIDGNPISVYVDGRIADSTGVVHTSGAENIAGIKTFQNNVKMTASYATLEFTPPSDSGNDSKQAVRFTTSAGALKSFVGYGSGSTNEMLRVATVGSLALSTPKVLIGTIASGTSGGGAGSMSIGCWGGAYTGIWAGGLTESATNEGIRLGPNATLINAPLSTDNVHIRHGETRKNVVFNADPIANATTQSDVRAVTMGGYINSGWSIWGGNVTAGTSNYAFYAKGDATSTEINGTTECTMRVSGAAKIKAISTGAEVTGTLTATSGLIAESYMSVYGTLSAQNVSNSIFTSSTTSGTVNWDASTSSVLYLNGQLTGALTVSFISSPDAGCVQHIYFRQHASAAQTFTISGGPLNRTIRQSGVNASGNSRAVSGVTVVAAYYLIKILWITSTTCIISVDAA